ncbi:hypothetical protein QZH41_016183 [Actinostola sp. cb2023]|nr:hypothetical protein QZH41_016183 [Actinostola sp. cb2023]
MYRWKLDMKLFDTGPYLEILEQPKSRGFRFRYPCEGPSHGGLPGEFTSSKNKSYPSVQLCNYKGPCRIVVSLVTEDEPHMPHAHSLTGKNASPEGIVTVQIGLEQGMTASFPNLGVQHVTKKMVARTLTARYGKMQALQAATISALASSSSGTVAFLNFGSMGSEIAAENRGPFDRELATAVAGEESKRIIKLVQEQSKNMNLSAVKLCFQAYLPDDSGNFTKPLKPCISNSVFDSKAPASCQLKICRMDRNSGCVTGGDEIYLLCDRVQREDIEVRFYEYNQDGNVTWEDLGSFAPADVHRQFAIVFKTPAYQNIAIERPVKVSLELRRKSDKETSEPVDFTYTPQMFDTEQIGVKRRKKVPHFSEYFPPGGPPGPAGGGGGGFGIGGAASTGFLFDFSGFGLTPSTSTTTQETQGSSSGGTQDAPCPTSTQPSVEMLKELALAVTEHASSAMRDYAATGDVRYLLSIQRQLTAIQNDDGDTALHLAVINCQFAAVEGLVSVMKSLQGDFINIFNYLRQTPLHLASITKQPLAAECLLRGNANASLCDRHGNTPVHTACSHGDVGCLRVLLDRRLRKETEFPEIHWQNYDGYTPLHLAVIKGNREIIKMLISVGANVETKDGTCGRTPLHLAIEHNNLAIAGFLILEAKCDVDSYTYDDNTPLHLAAGLGLEGQTALLVAAGADTMATNSEDETPYSLSTTAEVKKILGDDEVPSDDMNTSDSGRVLWYYYDPVIRDMAAIVNKDVRRFTTPPETTRLVTSSNYGNTKNMQAAKDIMDREDSGVEGDSGFGSHSIERSDDSFSFPCSTHPDKIMRPITDQEPHFELDHNQPLGRAQ